MAGEKILGMINRQSGKDSNYSDILYGSVISTSPLTVRVDSGMELPEAFLEVGRFGKSRTVNISGLSVTVEGKIYGIGGPATVIEYLAVGDSVSLVRGHGGQRFYILERT